MTYTNPFPALLGMGSQPDPYQSLLGGYYTPQQARMAWLGGTLQGIGAGLASGRPGAWAQGAALGGGEGLDNYRQRATVAATLQQRKDQLATENQHWDKSYALQKQQSDWSAQDHSWQQRNRDAILSYGKSLPVDQQSMFFADPSGFMQNQLAIQQQGRYMDLALRLGGYNDPSGGGDPSSAPAMPPAGGVPQSSAPAPGMAPQAAAPQASMSNSAYVSPQSVRLNPADVALYAMGGPQGLAQIPQLRQNMAKQQQEATISSPGYQASVEQAKKEASGKGDAATSFSDINTKLPGLITTVGELGDLANKATYTLAGQGYNYARTQLGMAPTDGQLARTAYDAKVSNQILPLLRQTFGAQFTAREGDTLRATLGDPDKTPQEKQIVLQAFIDNKVREASALGVQSGKLAAPTADIMAKAQEAIKSGADPLAVKVRLLNSGYDASGL